MSKHLQEAKTVDLSVKPVGYLLLSCLTGSTHALCELYCTVTYD